jgi:ribonuclease BN (tRNA processing enzyme)
MKIQFIGVGSAFTSARYYQSNMLITARSGKKLLLDCGSDARLALAELAADDCGRPTQVIDAVYISHLHADHIGSLEWLAFSTYFNPSVPKPRLFMEKATMHELWNHSLSGGLGSIGAKLTHLSDFFTCKPLPPNGSFEWEGIHAHLFPMPHIRNGYRNHYSYGLHLHENGQRGVFISTDSLLVADFLATIAPRVDFIFHDCETGFKTGVHAHYEELRYLPEKIKAKTWLYHYQPNPPYDARADGFCGFVHKAQIFEY